jgi:hypothetical protein
MASLDVLVATVISNAIVLLSLLQDRGYKKRKYKPGTTQADLAAKAPFDAGRRRSDSSPPQTKWGSNENLVSLQETDSRGRSDIIRMKTLKGSTTSKSSLEKRSQEDLNEPPRAKLQDIRIASTWEVSITQK